MWDNLFMDEYPHLVVLAACALLGVWAMVNPAGVIGWAKRAHPSLSEEDPEVQSVAKFIGACFVGMSILVFLAFAFTTQ